MSALDKVSLANDAGTLAERVNRECTCVTLDREVLCAALEREAGDPDFCATLMRTRPHLFSSAPVFLSQVHVVAMLRAVRAIESVTRLPAYRDAVLARTRDRAARFRSAWRLHGLRLPPGAGPSAADRDQHQRRRRVLERSARARPARLL